MMKVVILVSMFVVLMLSAVNLTAQDRMKTNKKDQRAKALQEVSFKNEQVNKKHDNKVHTNSRPHSWIISTVSGSASMNSTESGLETTQWNSSLIDFAQKHRIVKRHLASFDRNKTTSRQNYTRSRDTTASFPTTKPFTFLPRTLTVVIRQPTFVNPNATTSQSRTTRPAEMQTPSRDQNLECSREKTCERRCTNTTEWRTENKFTCFCDPDCYVVFDDCCSDYATFCGVQKPKNDTKKKFAWECVNLGNIGSDNSDDYIRISDGVWMVTQCSPDWPRDYIRDSCRNPIMSTDSPDIYRAVPILNQDNITFRNVYCALCNYAADTYEPWTFSVTTEIMPPTNLNLTGQIRFFLAHAAKFREYSPKLHQPRRYCVNEVIETCPEVRNGEIIIERKRSCRNDGVQVVSVFLGLHYINEQCARCNSFGLSGFLCFPEFIESLEPRPLTFSLVLDFRYIGDEQGELVLRQAQCNMSLIFDEILHVCTGNWLRPFPETGPERYHVILWLHTIPQIQIPLSKTIVKQSFLEYFQFLPQNFNVSEIRSRKDFFLVQSTVILTPEQSFEIRSRKLDNPSAVKILNLIHFRTTWGMKIWRRNFTVFKTTSRPLKCFGRKLYTSSEYLTLDDGKIFINTTNSTYEKTQYYTDIAANGSIVQGNITICENYIPTSCNSWWNVLPLGQFVILENLSIYDKNTSSLYDYGQYEALGNNSVQICIPGNERYMFEYGEALTWITILLFMLPILSLITLLTTYTIFPELRTLPGKNLMNLATSLLMADILWLIFSFSKHEDYPKFCTGFIVLQHYFLLSTFASMSVISFHTYKTFTRKLRAPKSLENQERKLFKIYLSIIWVFPAIFVSTCFLLDWNNIMKLDYGDSEFCWFRQKDAFIYVLLIPTALSMVFNVVAFLAAALYLHKHSQNMAARECVSIKRSNLVIYIKLSTLMGFTWLFGLLEVVFRSSNVFEYPFVMSTCLQGVFISVAFVFKKKTAKMYREKIFSGTHKNKIQQGASMETVL